MEMFHSLAEERLSKRHRTDEDTCVEGGIALIADIEVENEFPSPRKYRCDGNRFGESYQC